MELHKTTHYSYCCPKDTAQLHELQKIRNKKITYQVSGSKKTQNAHILEQAYECPTCKFIFWKPYHPYSPLK